jgi:Lysylphosphatidylglycerol synthase TM region
MRRRWTHAIPWLITVMIFVYIFYRVPFPEVFAALRQARLLPYVALMVPYSVVYCLVDAFVVTRLVQWFHRRVPYRRILPVRASSYILSLLNPGLGQGALAYYVHRRERLPFLALAGTMLFLAVMEFCQLALYAAVGIFAFHAHLRTAFAPFYAVLVGVLGIGLLLLHGGMGGLAPLLTRLARWLRRDPSYRLQLRSPALLGTLRQARLFHYVLTLLYKAPNFFLAVVVHYFALQQFGVHVPLVHLFTFLPIVFLVAALPITVAHLGTSQAAWLYFFAAYAAESQLLAYSLVAHVTFMVLNGLIGLVFLPWALQEGDGAKTVVPGTDVRSPRSMPEVPET